ncbi:MAG: FAD binding domain-containing protein, partial [Candidatus Eisenbacteria bacterium]|nr:FAD binding domain-containing protein [Candidatus Eisenbacteria bacterium]
APRTVEEALAALDAADGARPIAGGTDLAVRILDGAARPPVLVDLGRVAGLDAIVVGEPTPGVARVEIGALATHAAVAAHPVVRDRAPALAAACRTIGSRQVRERGTLCGNVANASPAADGAVALLALDAAVTARSSRSGATTIPLESFLLGPGETTLRRGELIVSVGLDCPSSDARGAYLKMGQRRALAIAIASVAVVFEPRAGTVRIAIGSAAPTPVRARTAEELFAEEWHAACGRGNARAALIAEVARRAAAATSPIDDVRASAWYRTALVEALTRQALEEVCA